MKWRRALRPQSSSERAGVDRFDDDRPTEIKRFLCIREDRPVNVARGTLLSLVPPRKLGSTHAHDFRVDVAEGSSVYAGIDPPP